ncbi:MAG: hypothetical protein RR478_04295 [Bacilli bacterium]
MGLFDRKPEKNKASFMNEAQKNREKHAIWGYYKQKNENLTSKPPKRKK